MITRPDGGIDGQMLHLLHTTLTLDDLYDMLEAREVWQSWSHAQLWNSKERERRG